MFKKLFITCCFIFQVNLLLAQHPSASPSAEDSSLVKWLDFKEAFEKNKTHPLPFLIDIYTDWCGWCKHMMRTTYSTPGLAGYINANFYPVKFNAETKDTIEYLGTKYFNAELGTRSPHQLAIKFLGERMSYPSTVFINNNFQFSLLSAGYLDVRKIEPLLIYTVENIFRTTQYEDFKKYYELAYPETPAENTKPENSTSTDNGQSSTVNPHWYSFNEALLKQKNNAKKLLVFVHTEWCNGCRIMKKTTFTPPDVVKYLEEKYYLVDLNAETKDTILFAGQTFVHEKDKPFHQFVYAALKGNVFLPSCIVFNQELQAVDAIPYYLTPETMEPILKYYGDEAYKTTKWEDFRQRYSEKK